MATSDLQSYRILLVGKTGSGKSSTGNSILDQNVFKSRKPYDSSDGDVIACYSSVVEGRYVFVVDGTGIGDTGVDLNGGVISLLQLFDSTMKHEMSLFNAIVLVHFIHERSQVTMKNSVHAIKSILGPNVFKNWGIIVVTFGDLFDVNNLGENIHSFEDWCQQQTGYFQILLEECNNRGVLFDNKTMDKNKQMEQRHKLMSVVDNITYKQYTIDEFDSPACKLSRKHLILMEEVNRKFEDLEGNINSKNHTSKQELELLIEQFLEHKQRLIRQGQESEFSEHLLNEVIETVKMMQIKIGNVFQEFKPTVWEECKCSLPIYFKAEEPTTFPTKQPLSPPVAELSARKVTTSVSEIQDDKKVIKIDASRRQESDFQNETLKEMCRLLLVGRSGNGKSSVGNSILGDQFFKTRGPSEVTRLTNEIHSNDDYVVVDCSGFGDTEADMPGDMSSIVLSACKALIINNKIQVGLCKGKTDNRPTVLHRCGFDALIFVMKYGVQFTEQDKDAVQMVKFIFGENVFRDWGILVFSYGDTLKYVSQESKRTFKDWCMGQRSEIRALFEEVSYRCVLFDNKTRDKSKMDQQRRELSEHIQTLKKQTNKEVGQKKYCIEEFIAVRKKHIQETFERLSLDIEKLLAETNTNAKRQILITLKGKWLIVKKQVEGELELFSWEATSQASPETGSMSNTVQTSMDTITLLGFRKAEREELNTKKDNTTIYKHNTGVATRVETGGLQQWECNNSGTTQAETDHSNTTPGEAVNSEHKTKYLPEKGNVPMGKLQLMILRDNYQHYFNHEYILIEYTHFLKGKHFYIDNNIEKIKTDKNECLLS